MKSLIELLGLWDHLSTSKQINYIDASLLEKGSSRELSFLFNVPIHEMTIRSDHDHQITIDLIINDQEAISSKILASLSTLSLNNLNFAIFAHELLITFIGSYNGFRLQPNRLLISFNVSSVSIKGNNSTKTKRSRHYFINPPVEEYVLPNIYQHHYIVENNEIFPNNSNAHNVILEKGDTHCLTLEYKESNINVYFERELPNVRKGVVIDYSKELNDEDKTIITAYLSFLFGKRLMNIGHIDYDYNDNIVDRTSMSPMYSEMIHQRPMRPLLFSPDSNINIQDFASVHLESFVVQFKQLNLERVLILYSFAAIQPLDLAILSLQTALESMVSEYYEKNEEELHYMEPSEFKKLTKRQIKELKDSVNLNCNISCLDNLNNKSMSRQMNDYLSKYAITMTEEEKELHKKISNRLRHGKTVDSKELWDAYCLYSTLINRIILKSIGSKQYYDANERKNKNLH